MIRTGFGSASKERRQPARDRRFDRRQSSPDPNASSSSAARFLLLRLRPSNQQHPPIKTRKAAPPTTIPTSVDVDNWKPPPEAGISLTIGAVELSVPIDGIGPVLIGDGGKFVVGIAADEEDGTALVL